MLVPNVLRAPKKLKVSLFSGYDFMKMADREHFITKRPKKILRLTKGSGERMKGKQTRL